MEEVTLKHERNTPWTYIAGPMRRKKYFNFPTFDKYEMALRNMGHSVINPAAMDRQAGHDPLCKSYPRGYKWDTIMEGMDLQKDIIDRDIAALRLCEFIVMLPGWARSTGARAEKAYMEWRGKQVYYASKLYRTKGGMLRCRIST